MSIYNYSNIFLSCRSNSQFASFSYLAHQCCVVARTFTASVPINEKLKLKALVKIGNQQHHEALFNFFIVNNQLFKA